MSLFFTQLLSFHTPEETYLYCVSVFSIPENPHFPELPDYLLNVIKILESKRNINKQPLLPQLPMSLLNLPASTEVRSSSFSILIYNSVVYITLHWQQFFRNTYLSSSSNISRWAACAGIGRSCAYTASHWRTRDRPCHGFWIG